jgi:hypothetical protein
MSEFQMKKVMGCVKWSRRVSQMRTRVPIRHNNTMWRSLVTLPREVLWKVDMQVQERTRGKFSKTVKFSVAVICFCFMAVMELELRASPFQAALNYLSHSARPRP